jgi:Ca-activated chloride channel homolog
MGDKRKTEVSLRVWAKADREAALKRADLPEGSIPLPPAKAGGKMIRPLKRAERLGGSGIPTVDHGRDAHATETPQKDKAMRPNNTIPLLVLSLGLLLNAAGWGESSVRDLNKAGVEAYRKSDYSKAQEQFDKAARQAPDNLLLTYNSGAAKAGQEKMDEAQQDFDKVGGARDQDLAARAQFAKGVVNYHQAEKKQKESDFQAALDAIKAAEAANMNVLRAKPDDSDARVNLELATRLRKEIEKQLQQQKDKEQQQQKNKDQQDKDKQKQDQQKQDQDKKDQEKKDQEKQQNDQKQDQKQKEDQEKQDQKQNEDQQKQNQEKQDQNKEDQAKKDEQKQSEEQKAQQEKDQKQDGDAAKDKARQEQMDKDAARSILNLLDENDVQALRRMLRERYGRVQHPEKDW